MTKKFENINHYVEWVLNIFCYFNYTTLKEILYNMSQESFL